MSTGLSRPPDSKRSILMLTEKAREEPQTCPHCGQVLHDEPIVVDHALRVGLTCDQHGIASIVEPFTP